MIDARQTLEIRVCGIVQGVGFRPTVWRLARDEGLVGEVFNDGSGVMIRTTGTAEALSRFRDRLYGEAPPLSRIETVQIRYLDHVLDFEEFRIVESAAGENHTRVAPDAAICAACRAEIEDPAERRSGYPFTNCTHCGPRFSIVNEVPYDRARTTMSAFPMCPACRVEYERPSDRRFHAQPIACPECGPSIWLEFPDSAATGISGTSRRGRYEIRDWRFERALIEEPGQDRASYRLEVRISDLETASPAGPPSEMDALVAAVELLDRGGIVAIRGLGGFHLACDATDPRAVRRLRDSKRRYGKPFALMARDLDAIRRYCLVSTAEADLLQGPQAPVVLLDRGGPETLPDDLAPGMNTLGFMLSYTPLHTLIMRNFDRPLVMTSGNLSDEPQVTGLDDARARLRGIADALLMHDREIANRIDDSVVRVVAGRPRMIRRARGYAPDAMPLPKGFEDAPDLLAYGGELKAAFCLVKDGAAILSQHQGDLEDAATFEDYQKNLRLYARLYDHRPRWLAADLHPEYLSTKLARRRAADDDLPLLSIQHHHAHVASCMAENGVPLDASPVLGIALDGLGLGDDGTIWGGEFLLADYRDYRRLASFRPIAMLGGAQAIREPWRSVYAHLVSAMGWRGFAERFSDLALFHGLSSRPLATFDRMVERGLNVPLASSCGRLFDAVAAALGFCPDRTLFEGQGAMELEAIADPKAADPPYPFAISEATTSGLLHLEPAPMWEALLDDLARKTAVAAMSARFHRGLALAIRAMVDRIRDAGATFDTVVLSGGCIQNRLLVEELLPLLETDGRRCLLHAKVPANDGGLALGQAAIAAARQIGRPEPSNLSSPATSNLRSEPCVWASPARS